MRTGKLAGLIVIRFRLKVPRCKTGGLFIFIAGFIRASHAAVLVGNLILILPYSFIHFSLRKRFSKVIACYRILTFYYNLFIYPHLKATKHIWLTK
jgi:hypothetical protein